MTDWYGPACRVLAVAWLLFFAACASEVRLQEDPEDYREEVARLQREIAEHPDEAQPLRDLGVIYMRTQRPSQAREYLQQAFSRDDDDPKTLFYLGIANEKLGKEETALRLYGQYSDVSGDSPYRKLMEGRYEWLVRKRAREEIRQMLAREEERGGGVSPRIVAVLPLSYQGGNDRYAPLGRGLSEMLTVDLGSIDRLTLVERVRLQALLDELKLAQSDFVDPSSAPRVGRLLGAGRLVGGSYNVLGDESLRLDVALANIDQGTSPDFETRSGALDRLFDLEKQLVFRVIDQLGVELTAEERAAIEYVPTQNLQAFLAYSRGLLEEDRGNFQAASQAYQRAHQIDPGFDRAGERQEKTEGMSAAAGSTDEALLGAVRIEPPASTIDLLDSRLRKMSGTLGAGFVPGQDARQPAAESVGATELGQLEDPPPPPPPGGGQ